MGTLKSKVIHYVVVDTQPNHQGNKMYWACDGFAGYYHGGNEALHPQETLNTDQVTCKSCLWTKRYKRALKEEKYPLFCLKGMK